MDVFDQIECEVTACHTSCPPQMRAALGTVGAIGSGTIAGVLRGLQSAGVSFLDVLKWLPVVLQLVATVGPQIAAIIQQIVDAINGGKTPATFAA